MKVCLIRPPALIDKYGFAIDPVPPVGLAYIAASVREVGYEVYVIDAIGEHPLQYNPIQFTPKLSGEYNSGRLFTNGLSNAEIIELIQPETTVVGLSCMFSNNWLADKQLIADIKSAFPELIIIAGGESISAKPELWMEQAPGLDICAIGEGEETIQKLLIALDQGLSLDEVEGIVYRSGENLPIQTKRRTRLKSLDSIPLPAWDLFPIENYQKYKLQYTVTPGNSMPIVATRGCPYSCTFCSSPQMWGTRYYMRTPEDVANEMEQLISLYNADEIDFYDLTAIIKRDWILAFCKVIVERNIKVKWNLPAGTRSEAIDEEVAQWLYKSGCSNITYAPESGSERMLKLIKKKVSLSTMLDSMRASNKNGMRIYLNMILALPEERHVDIWKTMWFLVQCSWVGAYEVGLAMFHPYPGSALFEQLLKEGRIDFSNDDFFYHTITITPVEECGFHYNKNVSAKWYRFYNILAYIIFFSSNYLFRPVRFFRFAKNIITKSYNSRFERTMTRLVHNEKTKAIPENDKLEKAPVEVPS